LVGGRSQFEKVTNYIIAPITTFWKWENYRNIKKIRAGRRKSRKGRAQRIFKKVKTR
jgi:hypothetical protein